MVLAPPPRLSLFRAPTLTLSLALWLARSDTARFRELSRYWIDDAHEPECDHHASVIMPNSKLS
jgi:hypothetical protein